MRITVGVLLATVSLVLTACAGVDESLKEDPLYQLGYNDGCASAHQGSTFGKPTRNKEYSGKSKAYDTGWANGYGSCGRDPNKARRGDIFEDDSHTGRQR